MRKISVGKIRPSDVELNREENSKEESGSKESSAESKGLKYVFVRFAQKSTNPGITLIYNSIRISRKLIWLVFLISGLCLSIYQSIELIQNYFSYPSFNAITEKFNRSFYFPSLTFCPSNIVHWKKVTDSNHSIRDVVEKKVAELRKVTFEYNVRDKIKTVLLDELQSLEPQERTKILINEDDWITHVYFSNDEKNSIFYDFNSTNFMKSYTPGYGSCITFNPGLTEESKIRMGTSDVFFLMGQIDKGQESPFASRFSKIYLFLHSPGTAPVFPWNKGLEIFPGEYLHLAIKMREIKRLTSPYASHCNDNEEELSKLLLDSPYQTEETPYVYSREECMAGCTSTQLLQEVGCYMPEIFLKNISQKHRFCSGNEIDIPFAEAEEKCIKVCPIPCRELTYDWTPKSSGLFKRQSKLLWELLEDILKKPVEDLDNVFMLTVNIDSNDLLSVEETAKYQLEDLLGSIGGSFGLWIGLCVLSVLELFELVLNITTVLIHKIKC